MFRVRKNTELTLHFLILLPLTRRQIQQMCAFILQEATEKCKEIKLKVRRYRRT